MDEGMGLDADGMKRSGCLLEVLHGAGPTRQIRAGRREHGTLSTGMPLQVAKHDGQSFRFMVQADGMFQQLFPLIGHEVDQDVGSKREYPIAGEQPEQ